MPVGAKYHPTDQIFRNKLLLSKRLIVEEFPKDPAPIREQMIDTYFNTPATVLGSMEEAKKNICAFSSTTYTGFQFTVSEEPSEKFKGLPGVLWVWPDSYMDVKNKDYAEVEVKLRFKKARGSLVKKGLLQIQIVEEHYPYKCGSYDINSWQVVDSLQSCGHRRVAAGGSGHFFH